MTRTHHRLLAAVAVACAGTCTSLSPAFAQVPAAPAATAPGPVTYSAPELEKLVGPFALYPDDLVAIILPASTFPLQIVQADRFLDRRKSEPQLQIDQGWDDSVKALVNYPDLVKRMSVNLDWTEGLGEAVVASSEAVMGAVQAFRRKTQAAGNLKSDERQVVEVHEQVIQIAPADPTVIYVPQYEPAQVTVVGAPVYSYAYSPPYPVYYYPYPPGAALATGIIWGAALGAAWNGGRYGADYGNNNVTINRGNNTVNTGNTRVGGGNRATQLPANTSAWKSSKQPGQVGSTGARGANTRVGDPRPGTGSGSGSFGGAGSAERNFQGAGGRGGTPSASTRPSPGTTARAQGGAFGGMDAGSSVHRASARGSESRGGAQAGNRSAPRAQASGGASGGYGGGGGGGARAGGGGGGARAGGGGGGGGRGGGGGGGGGGGRGR